MAVHKPMSLRHGQNASVSIVKRRVKLFIDDELEGEPGVSVVMESDEATELAELIAETASEVDES